MNLRGKKLRGLAGSLVMMTLLLLAAAPVYGGGLVNVPNSVMPVLSLELVRQDQAVIGEGFTIVYRVKNISDKPAFKINYNFELSGVEVVNPFDVKEKPAEIEMLDPGASANISVKFAVKTIEGGARERTYRIRGYVTCQDASFGNTMTYSAITDIPVGIVTAVPNLLVQDLRIVGEDTNSPEGFEMTLLLKNSSMIYDMRNITLQLDGGENFETMDVSNKKEIGRISANEGSEISFKLRVKDGRKSNTATLNVNYSYSEGKVSERVETLFLPLPEDTSDNGRVPRVIIKRYSLSKDRVLAGDRIDLTLVIENTNSRPVKNVLINFGVDSITSDSGGSRRSTVFAPVNSSNTFHIDQIAGQAVVTNTITFSVDPGAAAQTYIVPVTIKYEDERGLLSDLSVSDTVNIPVTQEAKLSVSSMVFPKTAQVGMPVAVTAEFINAGKVDLTEFSVRLSGDFNVQDASAYQAKLAMGGMNSYTGMLIPLEEGQREGILLVSYTDNNNETVAHEYPFTVEVTPAEDMGAMLPEGPTPPEEPTGLANRALAFVKEQWVLLLLALVVVLQTIYIIRVKKKAKEEFFDE
ncbi:MAG: hypothetical protein LBK98_00505 [Peptococcaceae bacterium]|jgi:hypothetical protein|nr:hypothetical protein [Peptococcaceae bacterium]